MQWLHPEAFLLVPLCLLVLRGLIWPRPLLGVVRVTTLLCIAAVLAQPSFGTAEDGRDVILVVDRSRSMPDGHLQKARELAQQLEQGLVDGDRIGVVVFARDGFVVSHPAAELRWADDRADLNVDGSDLGSAMTMALGMVEDGRNATLLVWSDGEVSVDAAAAVARMAARRGVRIDVQPVARSFGRDAAVHLLRVPAEVPIEAPFAINATVVATAGGAATWQLRVDGDVARSGSVTLRKGRNTLQLQHRIRTPGEQVVSLEVTMQGDAVRQNDRGQGVVRGIAKTRVLCVTPDGREDRLTGALRDAGIEVVVAAPLAAPLTLAALDGFRAVVLEDVPAASLPPNAMVDLAQWVRDLGGGLLMTGGQNSFGVGGYYRSPVEDVLPVTMEIREEQRKFGLAMAIALDRSGSMRASAGGTTKMQLANLGAVGAIELMSPIDAVAVLAVDTGSHVVQPLVPVEDVEQITAVVRKIEVGGGGIYIGEALHDAAQQLEGAAQQSRHIVIFADASDAEEPLDYETFLPELVEDGITVSVIGLGAVTDRDGLLLEEIAALGKGRCQFVGDATALPRVFAQETIQVARSSLVEEETAIATQPSLQLLGDFGAKLPPVGGYTVAWTRALAERDIAVVGEDDAPILAHWQVGLGRGAAFLGEADGKLTGAWRAWPGYADFFSTVVRWLCGGAPAGLFVDARREGDLVVYQLEVDVERARVLDTAHGRRTEPDGTTAELVFEAIAPGRVEVRVPLVSEGVHRAAVQIGGDTVRLPPMCLPYSSEYALQPDPRHGERNLRLLARRTNGNVAPSVPAVLQGPRQGLGRRDLSPWFAVLALVLLLLEVAFRRLQVHLPRLTLRMPVRRRKAAVGAANGATQSPNSMATAPSEPASSDEHDAESSPPGAAQTEPQQDGLLGAMQRAQRRGRRP